MTSDLVGATSSGALVDAEATIMSRVVVSAYGRVLPEIERLTRRV
ncbi:hypothetical protein [uncultured Roseobacter sp.]|nr:hypothetical protein [uncultured Roseobacter sp.]